MKRSIIAVLTAATLSIMSVPAAGQTQGGAVGILEGPSAPKHRLTIVSAFSCPYCRVLDMQGMDEIRRVWIPKGLQLESVPVSISPTDVPAAIVATCGDPRQYARRSKMLFRAQPDVLGNWNGADPEAKKRAAAKPKGTSAADIGRLAGFEGLSGSLGLAPQQIRACLADPARQARQVKREALVDARWHIVGTPTAFLDGKQLPDATWQTVRTALTAAFR